MNSKRLGVMAVMSLVVASSQAGQNNCPLHSTPSGKPEQDLGWFSPPAVPQQPQPGIQPSSSALTSSSSSATSSPSSSQLSGNGSSAN